jgi:hypothetical protein
MLRRPAVRVGASSSSNRVEPSMPVVPWSLPAGYTKPATRLSLSARLAEGFHLSSRLRTSVRWSSRAPHAPSLPRPSCGPSVRAGLCPGGFVAVRWPGDEPKPPIFDSCGVGSARRARSADTRNGTAGTGGFCSNHAIEPAVDRGGSLPPAQCGFIRLSPLTLDDPREPSRSTGSASSHHAFRRLPTPAALVETGSRRSPRGSPAGGA